MLVADVTNILSIHEAVGQIISEQGRIDVLINNAGMGIGGALELATEDEISGQMNTNFFGVVNMCAKWCCLICARHEEEKSSISVLSVE